MMKDYKKECRTFNRAYVYSGGGSLKQSFKTIDQKDLVQKLTAENEQLREKLNEYKLFFEQAVDAIVILNEEFHFIHVNEASCHLFQLLKEELFKRNFFDFINLMPKEEVERQFTYLNNKGCHKDELIIKLDDGRIKYIEYSAQSFTHYHLFIIRDISARKINERDRTINEQLFQDLFDRAVDGIVIFDEDENFIDANHSFCSSFEISRQHLNQYKLKDFVTDVKIIERIKKSLYLEGKATGELEVQLQNGKNKLFEFTSTSNILNGFYMVILRDITEKRIMEQQLEESEERFRDVFEYALDAIVIWDKTGRIVRANQWACRTFELPLKQLLKSHICDFIDPKDPKLRKIIRKYFKSGAIREELLFHMANNQAKQLEFTSKRMQDGYHMTILRNVSDRKQMEKELRENEQKFRKVFNGAMDGIVLFDDNMNIIDANPAASKILSLPHRKIREYNLNDFISREMIEKYFGNCDKLTKELPFTLQNGEERIIECSFKRNIIENMNLAIFRDVTEKKEIEERLRKSDTLNVVGELAAGIAHEIRNPMTSLKGFIQLLKGSISEDHSMYFHVISSELKRIETIITEFLMLAKPQAIHYQQKHIVTIMKETIELLNAQAILTNVQIHLEYDPVPEIYCEPNQLKQVFINILKNAIEVMPKGGNIYVKIRKNTDQTIKISIQDEGTGIPKEKIKKLGEPFYTTKERGTGLGLMVSFKIIEEHNGKVEVQSKVGYGTTFYITLPIKQQDVL